MIRLAANVSMLYPDRPLGARIAAAGRAGFRGVEMHFPYDWPVEAIGGWLADAGVVPVLFNLPPGDLEAGDRGLAAVPGRESEFRDAVGRALDYAAALGCTRLHAMAGVVAPGADPTPWRETFVENLRWAAPLCAARGVRLLIEPVNPYTVPGYFLTRLEQAEEVLDEVAQPGLGLQFDLFHLQIVGGDLLRRFARARDRIVHVQIAGVPDRHEPDRGEVDHRYVLDRIDALGYDGWIGCEYVPAAGTDEGLGWAAAYGIRAPEET